MERKGTRSTGSNLRPRHEGSIKLLLTVTTTSSEKIYNPSNYLRQKEQIAPATPGPRPLLPAKGVDCSVDGEVPRSSTKKVSPRDISRDSLSASDVAEWPATLTRGIQFFNEIFPRLNISFLSFLFFSSPKNRRWESNAPNALIEPNISPSPSVFSTSFRS